MTRMKLASMWPGLCQIEKAGNYDFSTPQSKIRLAQKVSMFCQNYVFDAYFLEEVPPSQRLSVLKRSVPKTLAFAFGSRLRSKTRRSKTRVSWRRLPNGKPQERLRFRDLRSKMLAFKKKRSAIISCVLGASLGARACVQVLCVQKTRRFAFAFLSPLSSKISVGSPNPFKNAKESQGRIIVITSYCWVNTSHPQI